MPWPRPFVIFDAPVVGFAFCCDGWQEEVARAYRVAPPEARAAVREEFVNALVGIDAIAEYLDIRERRDGVR